MAGRNSRGVEGDASMTARACRVIGEKGIVGGVNKGGGSDGLTRSRGILGRDNRVGVLEGGLPSDVPTFNWV